MKRFVVLNSLGELEIITTSGQEPPGTISECHDDWTIHDITYSNGIVFRDPEKVRRRFEQEERERLRAKYEEKKTESKLKIKKILDSRQAWFLYGICWVFIFRAIASMFK